MGVFPQEESVLPHDETPDRVIDRGVFVVALVDRELEEVLGKRWRPPRWSWLKD